MRPRRLLIAANWKMHDPPKGFDGPQSPYRPAGNVDVVVFPTALHISMCAEAELETGGQAAWCEDQCARTGDIGMQMLHEAGARWVLCGHSERRRYHHETDAEVAAQAEAAIAAKLTAIVCVGETADEREQVMTQDVIRRQLQGILPLISASPDRLLIAYEPVWAISGGDPTKAAASAGDVQQLHRFIRETLPPAVRAMVRILYGGSMKAGNAAELLAQEDIDGGLVGGASLQPSDFGRIVDAAVAVG